MFGKATGTHQPRLTSNQILHDASYDECDNIGLEPNSKIGA